jgi:hypothetical protein
MEPEKRDTPLGVSPFPLKRWIVVRFGSYLIYTFSKYPLALEGGGSREKVPSEIWGGSPLWRSPSR